MLVLSFCECVPFVRVGIDHPGQEQLDLHTALFHLAQHH